MGVLRRLWDYLFMSHEKRAAGRLAKFVNLNYGILYDDICIGDTVSYNGVSGFVRMRLRYRHRPSTVRMVLTEKPIRVIEPDIRIITIPVGEILPEEVLVVTNQAMIDAGVFDWPMPDDIFIPVRHP